MSEVHVALDGRDGDPGTADRPLATPERARAAVRELREQGAGPVTVFFHAGTWYLDHTLVLGPEDSGLPGAAVTWTALPGAQVTLSGGRRLDCRWRPYRDGIMVSDLPAEAPRDFTQLFVNGTRRVRARFPNEDDSDPRGHSGYIRAAGAIPDDMPDPDPGPDDDMTFSGGAPTGVLFDPAAFPRRRWARPSDAVIHIFQGEYWGNLQWQVKDIDRERGVIWFGRGGHQVGAKWDETPCVVNADSCFFIENIFEEIDAPGEWYLDRARGRLYFSPPAGLDLDRALVEVPVLETLVRLEGTQDRPVHDVVMDGFRLAHATSTFLEPYEVPSLGDWAIHRGGAVLLTGTRDCAVRGCFFDAVGGNGVFVSRYNRRARVTGCTFSAIGESAVCFVGSLEHTVGTQRSFPFECEASGNLVHDCGAFGKQVAGVYISRARRITVAHNEIHRMPRAGICIGDGTWGGHVVEFNRVHDTCRETVDHGPFNAWGRDRYWCLSQSHMPYTTGRSHDAGRVTVDAMEPVIVRNNVFEETSGWGLDLDDGASNYEIYNNLCVGVSVKLREGARRTVANNIWVNGATSPCFHVGNEDNHDRYVRNITVMSVGRLATEHDMNFSMGRSAGEIYTLIAPPARGPWLEEVDHNCFFSDVGEFRARVHARAEGRFETWEEARKAMDRRTYSLEEWRALGFDRHSVFADPLFVDPAHGDYRLRPESPALALGFIPFDPREAGLPAVFRRWEGESGLRSPGGPSG